MTDITRTQKETDDGEVVIGLLSAKICAAHILVKVKDFVGFGSYDTIGDQTRHINDTEPSYNTGVALCGRKTDKDLAGVVYSTEKVDHESGVCKACLAKYEKMKTAGIKVITEFER